MNNILYERLKRHSQQYPEYSKIIDESILFIDSTETIDKENIGKLKKEYYSLKIIFNEVLVTFYKETENELKKIKDNVDKIAFLKDIRLTYELFQHELTNLNLNDSIQLKLSTPGMNKGDASPNTSFRLIDEINSLKIKLLCDIISYLTININSLIDIHSKVINTQLQNSYNRDRIPEIKGFSFINNKRNSNRLDNLFDSLKNDYELIDNKITKPVFKRIFSEKKVDKPIIWIGPKSTLSYFIKQLYKKGFINGKTEVEWEKVIKCFVAIDSNYDRMNLKDQKTPIKDSAIIDQILSHLD